MGLPRKLLGQLNSLARHLPGPRAAEQLRYARIEARLAAPAPDPPRWPERLLPVPPAPVVRQAIAGTPGRVIDLSAPTAADHALLADAGIQLGFARANRAPDPRAALLDEPVGPAAPVTGAAALAFQDAALAAGSLAALCPWSGRAVQCVHAFIAEHNAPIFYRCIGAEVFYVVVGREGRGYVKLYLWLPARNLALLLAEPYRWHGFAEIEQLRSQLIADTGRVIRYLRRPRPPALCALVDNNHFAHHIWNALSGLERLIETDALGRLDRLICAAEPLGSVEAIFPELAGVPIERSAFPDLIETALERHWLMLRPGGNRISPRLIGRLRRVARQRVGPAAGAAISALREGHWPILWITVRVENRTWVRQTEGLISIARSLAADHPRAALIIDGFSVPDGPPNLKPAHEARLIAAERAVVAAIRAGLGDTLPVVSLVGESIFAAIAWAAVADLYLAHHGSVQHKIGWFGDCPGLVHSNRLALSDRRVQDGAREARDGGVPPTYLDPTLVTDQPGAVTVAGNRWPDDLANYDLDPAVAARELLRLLPPDPKARR